MVQHVPGVAASRSMVLLSQARSGRRAVELMRQRQPDANGEPSEKCRQPFVDGPVGGSGNPLGHGPQPEQAAQAHHDQHHHHPGRDQPPSAAEGRQHEQRERAVERHLGRQAPHLRQPARQHVPDVDIGEGERRQPASDPEVLVDTDERECHHGGHEIDREDAQESLPEVVADGRRRQTGVRAGQPGPRQQEARENEEDRNTDVEPCEQAAPGAVLGVGASPECGVGCEHAEGADEAQRVQGGERLTEPRLTDRVGNDGSRHSPRPSIIGPPCTTSTHNFVSGAMPETTTESNSPDART